ncbi:proteinase-activated receptor 4-like [Pelodiscus sinensis]|uniref:proteinase-activated receptor 4-like n=1 Tax=Pelodiscus sinensis TaxID=13735 RepID=UPI003F6D96BB
MGPLRSARAVTTGAVLLLAWAWLGGAEPCPTEPRPKGRAMVRPCEGPGGNVTLAGSWLEWHLRSPVSTRLLPALYGAVLLLGLPANALAFGVLAATPRKCASTLFLLNLAGADLLLGLLLPFRIAYHLLGNDWRLGEAACRALLGLFYGNMYGSVLLLTCIGLDRYLALVHPFLWRGSRHLRPAAGLCGGLWLAVALGLSPLLRHPHTQHLPELNLTTCQDVLERQAERQLAAYFCALVGLGFAAPFLLLACAYGRVLGRLLLQGRRHARVVRLLALVLLAFALCFTPSNVLLLLHALQPPGEAHNRSYSWYTLALALSAANTCLDPLIYFYASQDFRARLRALLRRGRSLRPAGAAPQGRR